MAAAPELVDDLVEVLARHGEQPPRWVVETWAEALLTGTVPG